MTALDLHVHHWEAEVAPGLPTLLLLHGTGGDENDLLPLGRVLLPGAALLSVRGNVLEHGAHRFFRRLAEGVFDLEDLRARTFALGQFLEAARAEYGMDKSQLYAVGYSNGANVAASLLLTDPTSLAGAVLFRAMVPFEPARTPQLQRKKVLISAGTMDPMISRAGTERLVSILRAGGAEVEVRWQRASHGLVQDDLDAAQEFLKAAVTGAVATNPD